MLPATFGGRRGGTQVFIKTLTGRTITIDDVEGRHVIFELKMAIRRKMRLIFTQYDEYYLIFGGHRLVDHQTLNFYNIVSGSAVWMVMRLRGGMDAGAALLATQILIFFTYFSRLKEATKQITACEGRFGFSTLLSSTAIGES